MPPKVKITEAMILNAAFSIVREQGHTQLSARAIAQQLGCSTQPVLYHFPTIDAIREQVYRMADEFHTQSILPGQMAHTPPLLELGLNYIRFAQEEKPLFRFLFQSGSLGQSGLASLLTAPEASELIRLVSSSMNCNEAEAREAFLSLFATAHGLASLLANNAIPYEQELLAGVLERSFHNLQK